MDNNEKINEIINEFVNKTDSEENLKKEIEDYSRVISSKLITFGLTEMEVNKRQYVLKYNISKDTLIIVIADKILAKTFKYRPNIVRVEYGEHEKNNYTTKEILQTGICGFIQQKKGIIVAEETN